jgi:hypothetical protein
MKKVLLIGLILAILILAMPQGVSADTATVNAAVVESLSFSAAGSNVTSWNLYYFAPGPVNTNTGGLNLAVSLNNPWHITLSGDNSGHLQPYVSGTYTGLPLFNPLHIVNGGDDQAVSGTTSTIFTSATATDGWTRHYDYQQTLVVTDDPNPNYQIVMNVGLVNDGV